MSKTIAFLTTQLNGWYQTQVWQGMVRAARAQGCRLLGLVGNVDANTAPPTDHKGIFSLVTQPQVDGVLFSLGPISTWLGEQAFHAYLGCLGDKPTVSIGWDSADLDCVLPEGSGVEQLVEHLVTVHHCRRIVFLGGPSTNPDAQQRLQDYKNGMQKMGIPPSAELMECGSFTLEEGAAAMQRILGRELSFDAVLAANDPMALGAFKVLKSQGYRVPRDIKLVGYDDSREGRYMQPPLTTVLNPTDTITQKALELCFHRIENPQKNRECLFVPGTVLIRKSCGCLGTPQDLPVMPEEKQVVEMLVAQLLSDSEESRQHFLYWLRDQLSSGAPHATQDCERWVQLVGQELRAHISATHLEKAISIFGLAQEILFEARQGELNAELLRHGVLIRDLHRLESDVLAHVEPQKIMEAIATHLHTWCPGGARVFMFHPDLAPEPDLPYFPQHCSYKTAMLAGELRSLPFNADLLPVQEEAADIWTVVPIEHGGLRFGMMVLHDWVGNEVYVDNLRIIISAALAISWRTRSEAELRDTLRHLSLRDELTGLYNRRGMLELANLQQSRAQRERQILAVIMMDLDGLKSINDLFGHADGDLAIRTFGQVLQEGFRTSDVVARLGGDEFAGLAVIECVADLEKLLARIRRLTLDCNAHLQKTWQLEFSMGWSLWSPGDGSSMASHMEQADQMLYREKARKKRAES